MRSDDQFTPVWIGLGGLVGQDFDFVAMLEFVVIGFHNAVDLESTGSGG